MSALLSTTQLSLSTFPTPTLLLVAIAGAVATGTYIFGYIFLSGSKPGANPEQDKFVNRTCAPEGLLKSVLTWGYAKASCRRFRVDLMARLKGEPKAKAGSMAPDATLVSLDGTELSLLNDYVRTMQKGMPLVLNFGSFT